MYVAQIIKNIIKYLCARTALSERGGIPRNSIIKYNYITLRA